ncbi:MAG: ABC transporter ATP-binding protein [Candidatus Jettenia sp.]|nr:ABC transporter ATP-binding protein [Candidatus Jettenia sp.]
MPYCIETCNLTKRYPVIKGYGDILLHPFRKKDITALNNVNIQIKKNELFGLLGPNGAGKTTLIKILCTLVLPTSGRALVNGLDVEKDGKKIRKIIGYVIGDERSFYWRLTGRQNLRFFAKLNNISHKEADQKIKNLFEFMELTYDADRMFKDYSTGMRQKLAIARGLLTNPEIIFMDEPTSGLDPITAQKLIRFIREKLIEEEGKTVIFATHNLHEAEVLCDQIAIINGGKVKIAGTVKEIKKMFHSEKRYIIKLKSAKNGLVSKIQNIAIANKVTTIPDDITSDRIQIEFETLSNNGNIFQTVKELVDMGGEINSFYEKEISLGELFSKVMDAGNSTMSLQTMDKI